MKIKRKNLNICSANLTVKRNAAVLAMALAFLMMAPVNLVHSQTGITANTSAASASTTPASAYGDIMQYNWPYLYGNECKTMYSAGPGPNSADILWRTPIPKIAAGGGAIAVATDGKVYCGGANPETGKGQLYALDAFTGSILWKSVDLYASPKRVIGFAIEPNYLVVGWAYNYQETRNSSFAGMQGCICLDTRTGQVVWNSTSIFLGEASENCLWVSTTRMAYAYNYGMYSNYYDFIDNPQLAINAWNFSDPTKPPTLAWSSPIQGSGLTGDQCLGYGDGKVFLDLPTSQTWALNATTGAIVWITDLPGNRMYGGCFYDGKWLHGSLGDSFTALDGDTGKVLWDFKTGSFWSFWASGPAAAYGMVYELNSDGHIYALNVTTGQCIWKYGGAYEGNPDGALHFYQGFPSVVDGKVYACIGTGNAVNQETGQPSHDEIVCLDAYTGKLIWSLPVSQGTHDSFTPAYGNLYFVPQFWSGSWSSSASYNEVWCIGSSTPSSASAVNWSMFRGNPAQTAGGGVDPVGAAGPQRMELKWKFTTGGAVVSSATIVDGVVYIGSQDKNIYALNAYTGQKIWNFTTGYMIRSSPACVDGKVYTGADDGNVYCLDAATGQQIWKTNAGGIMLYEYGARPATIRSSPIVVNSKVYVGSLDGNLYCLDATTGNVVWKWQSGGAILSTPAFIANDGLYITSTKPPSSDPTPNNNNTLLLYKINPNTAAIIWYVGIPRSGGTFLDHWDFCASPTVADGRVFVPDDQNLYPCYCINATTGNIIWRYQTIYSTQSTVVSFGSILYVQEATKGPGYFGTSLSNPALDGGRVYLNDYFNLVCLNVTTGERIWNTWLAREPGTSPSYAYGKIYVGSDEGTMRVLNATDGKTLSYYHPASTIWSSPSLYGGNLYWGASDFNVYCFGEADRGLTTYYETIASASTSSPTQAATPNPSAQVVTPTTVMTQPPTQTSTMAPTPTLVPRLGTNEMAYIIIAVVVIVAAVAAYTLFKRKKK